ncbi:hypothetical protein QJQ45_023460, partial [Haematococcus lacustris]
AIVEGVNIRKLDIASVGAEDTGLSAVMLKWPAARPRGTDQRRGRVVLVDEHRTSRVSSAVNGQQPCESRLSKGRATRPADWKPPAGQVEHRLLRPAWSQQRDQPVRGLMWSPVVGPRKPPQAPCQLYNMAHWVKQYCRWCDKRVTSGRSSPAAQREPTHQARAMRQALLRAISRQASSSFSCLTTPALLVSSPSPQNHFNAQGAEATPYVTVLTIHPSFSLPSAAYSTTPAHDNRSQASRHSSLDRKQHAPTVAPPASYHRNSDLTFFACACSHAGHASEQDFHKLADTTLDELHEVIEAYVEGLNLDDSDVEYSQGVLSVKLGKAGTYVLNKQAPNRQIWLSSPVSGPLRFDWDSQRQQWVYHRDGRELLSLLDAELTKLCGQSPRLTPA